MPVTVVVGGQFGSEGKGKVAHYLAREQHATIAVRVGGSNSGHTAIDKTGVRRVFRVLPTASLLDDVICVLGAGTYIDIDVLLAELKVTRLSPERLLIDPNAYVITDEHKRIENLWGLREQIGSTGSGTGAAVAARITRRSAEHLAKNDRRLEHYTRHSPRPFLRQALDRKERVIIEGTQGFGLSVLHSPYYPKATSRDTTAAAFVSEAGLSPLDIDHVVLVIRAFPIRVPGDSGVLPRGTDWETVGREGNWTYPPIERTSVTDQVRRVGRFDGEIVRAAIECNTPTLIALNHLDYFDFEAHQCDEITSKVTTELEKIQSIIGRDIDLIGLGPNSLHQRHSLII